MTVEVKTYEEDLELVINSLNTLFSREAKEAFIRLLQRLYDEIGKPKEPSP